MNKIIHLLCLLEGCDRRKMDDRKELVKVLNRAAYRSNMTILKTSWAEFKPQGLSIILLLAESHIAIHTWPELEKVDLEIVSCAANSNPLDGLKEITSYLKPKRIKKKIINFI